MVFLLVALAVFAAGFITAVAGGPCLDELCEGSSPRRVAVWPAARLTPRP